MVESKQNTPGLPAWWSLDSRPVNLKRRPVAQPKSTVKIRKQRAAQAQKPVRIEIRRVVFARKLFILYSGMPNELISMGAVTADLLAPWGSTKARFDGDGDRLIVVRGSSGRVTVQYHKPENRALRLPGVAAWLAQESEVPRG